MNSLSPVRCGTLERRSRTEVSVRLLDCFALLPLLLCLLLTLDPAPLSATPARSAAETGYPSLLSSPFPPFCDAGQRRRIVQALIETAQIAPGPEPITGLTLPHHLLAAELIAQGFRLAAAQKPKRILILCPDHFHRAKTAFAVPDRDFATFLGPVPLDREGARQVLALAQVSVSSLFSHEHGIRVLLPFVARFFPGTPVLPLVLRSRATAEEREALIRTLEPLVQDALVIQSTDFSHEQPPELAARFDAESLAVLALNDMEQAVRLDPLRHVDSPGALALQMRLQTGQGSRPLVIVNRNSAEYAPKGEALPQNTTSYVLALWSPAETPLLPEGRSALVLAGDFFSGGYLTLLLRDPRLRRLFVERVQAHTGGAPLVLNFEGFLAPECPAMRKKQGGRALCMDAESTVALLRELNAQAVSLANNHSLDGGPEALTFTRERLAQAGILALGQGEMGEPGGNSRSGASLPPCRLVAFTDLDNHPMPRRFLLNESRIAETLTRARQDFSGPVIALVHFGVEFAPIPGNRERTVAALCLRHGADLVVGTHPHRAGELAGGDGERAGALVVWSLGNFLFDDPGPRTNGSLLALDIFPQATFWVRLIPWGNPYRELITAQRELPGRPSE